MNPPTVAPAVPAVEGRTWPTADCSRVPYWVYVDPALYGAELERIFEGASWSYVALEAEIPAAGDYRLSKIGERPVIVARGDDGRVHVMTNRCAHRGTQVCREPFGNAANFTCPYHQWCYKLDGSLIAVPFRKGVNGQGGMPAEFDRSENGLEQLAVTTRNGVVFASYGHAMPSFEDYLGPSMLRWFDRVFDGRELRVLGYQRQRVPANWKLMFENIKDPYHASLLHVFLVSFGLFRADQPSQVQMDETGRHSVLTSQRGAQQANAATAEMSSFRSDLVLADPRLLDPVREFPGAETVVMQTLWPNLIVQQQSNTLAMRQLVPGGPESFDLVWTFFGYADDDEEMQRRRLRQANLMGPSGYVSIDDSEVMLLAQQGLRASPDASAVVEMGGVDTDDTEHMVTEAAVRAFYGYYREVMGL